MGPSGEARGAGQPAPHYVSVVGGYDVAPSVLAEAETVGRLLAARGITVVTGGRGGVSEAASRGAFEAGGTTLGLLPGTDRAEANPWLTRSVVTGLGDTRNALVAMNGDGVIALDGAHGTLSEIAHALLLGRPVVGLGTWSLERPGGRRGPDRAVAGEIVAGRDPADAVATVCRMLGWDPPATGPLTAG